IGGTLHGPEVVKVTVRNEPFAVRMVWESGPHKDIVGATPTGVLYPYAEEQKPEKTNPESMAVWRPDAIIKYKSVDPKGDLARTAARYCVKEGGFDKSMLRTLDAWRKTKEKGELRTDYLGCLPVE